MISNFNYAYILKCTQNTLVKTSIILPCMAATTYYLFGRKKDYFAFDSQEHLSEIKLNYLQRCVRWLHLGYHETTLAIFAQKAFLQALTQKVTWSKKDKQKIAHLIAKYGNFTVQKSSIISKLLRIPPSKPHFCDLGSYPFEESTVKIEGAFLYNNDINDVNNHKAIPRQEPKTNNALSYLFKITLANLIEIQLTLTKNSADVFNFTVSEPSSSNNINDSTQLKKTLSELIANFLYKVKLNSKKVKQITCLDEGVVIPLQSDPLARLQYPIKIQTFDRYSQLMANPPNAPVESPMTYKTQIRSVASPASTTLIKQIHLDFTLDT